MEENIDKKPKKSLKKWLISHTHLFLLPLLMVLFFTGASAYNYFAQADNYIKWGSPDENANYVFSKLFAEEGQLSFFEKYNLYAADIIHPRSFRSDNGSLKPVSFLGIILIYGTLAKVLRTAAIPFFTPAIAALGLLFYFLFIKNVFGKKVAIISTALLSFFPVYIYYSARSMFHNVLFTVFLIVSLYFITLLKKVSRSNHFWRLSVNGKFAWSWAWAALAGSFAGLALLTRTSELIWFLPVLFLIWVFNIKRLGLTRLIIFISFLFLSLLPMLYWNQILYGSVLQGGYTEINRSLAAVSSSFNSGAEHVGNQIWQSFNKFIFYFGFHPYESAKAFYYYFVKMFPWLFAGAILGFLLLVFKIRKWQKRHYLYILCLLVLSAILILYYGSWQFNDNPDPKSFTIGNSYTRYWLPIYLGFIPLVAFFISRFSQFILGWLKPGSGKNFSAFLVRLAIVSLIAISSIMFVSFGSEEGLVYTYYKFRATKYEYQQVLANTKENSVIVTEYHDKVLFPERKVIQGLLTDPNMNFYYARLAERLPVYYYNFSFPPKDMDYLNSRLLANVGLNIKLVKEISSDFSLYELYKLPPIEIE